eukprot:6388140-Alexandrium_andersonii.AAC.1
MDVRRDVAERDRAEQAEPPALATLQGPLRSDVRVGRRPHALAALSGRRRAIAIASASDGVRRSATRSRRWELRANEAEGALAVPLEV